MAGLGDEVVTRCSACGYALTARRYAVPHECPICRAPLDAASASMPQVDAETRAQSPYDAEVTQETATFEPEMPSMSEPENRNDAEADAPHAEPSSSASPLSRPDEVSESPASRPSEPATHARDPRASTSPSLGSTSPSLNVTNATQPSADTSPLGSVTIPMFEPDVRGGPRKTESYTPLDAGELWSEFGDRDSSRTEPPQRVEPAPHAETKSQAETKSRAESKAEAAPSTSSPSSSSPATSSPTQSFSQSSMLGLSGAQQATHAAPPPSTTTSSAPAPPPFTTQSQPPAQVQPIRSQHVQGEFESRVSPEAVGRYVSAYRAARATVMLGTVIKILGALFGLVVGFGPSVLAIIMLRQFPPGFGLTLLVGLLSGFATFATVFVVGAIVSSLGQLRVAALDSAVNTSPFLTNEQRAEVMSLR